MSLKLELDETEAKVLEFALDEIDSGWAFADDLEAQYAYLKLGKILREYIYRGNDE